MSVVEARAATLRFGDRTLWSDLDLVVPAGEFLAVLGPNGAGKTSLLQVLLGLEPLTSGTVSVCGRPPRTGDPSIGYVPQQKAFDRDMPIRGRDFVALGVDGHRFGWHRRGEAGEDRIRRAIDAVGASAFLDAPLGQLSGGEQQRLRIAQALVGDPQLLLCDEPLLSLDLQHQRAVSGLIDLRRQRSGTAVIFVTHEVNPILDVVDRVLYFVHGRWAIGTPDEVITSERLSDLYETDVEVIRSRGRLIIVGVPDTPEGAHH